MGATSFASVHAVQRRRRALVASGVAVLVGLTGIVAYRAWPDGPYTVGFSSATTDAGSRELHLGLWSCNGEVQDVEVQEGADDVVVEVKMLGGQGGDDCMDSTVIELAEPLGDRRLIDGSTGERASIEMDQTDRFAWIQRAGLAEDDRTLTLATHACRPQATELVVDQEPDRVTVAVAHHGTPLRPGCHAEHTVVLDQPLGDRQLVDLSSGYGLDLYP